MLRTDSHDEASQPTETTIIITNIRGSVSEDNIDDNSNEPKQRNLANRQQRTRTQTMNSAFEDLRQHIPNVPVDTKLSKIKTLRLAISYIRYLMDVLEETKDGKPCTKTNFAVEMALQSDMKEKRRRDQSVSRQILLLEY